MKFVFLCGGLLGFVTGLVTSWSLDHAADRVFLDASLLFRWFWTVVLAGLRDTVVARHRAHLATLSAAPATTAPKVK